MVSQTDSQAETTMRFFSWLNAFLPMARQPRAARSGRRTSRHVPAAFRPRLEPLEDRCLLSGGTLDPTFGSGGLVTTAVGSIDALYCDVATYPQEGTANDGKIVEVGDTSVAPHHNMGNYMAVVRYNLNGTLDTSFGGTGEVTTVKGFATAVAVQPDGKVVVAGYAPSQVVRFNIDGTIDTSFGYRGSASTAIGVGGLVLQPDGKIIEAGYSGGNLTVERFNSDGTQDASFGSGGIVTTSFTSPLGPVSQYTEELALDPNSGKIVVAANSVIVRYNTNGSLDTGFGSNNLGYVTLSTLSFSTVAVQSDDRVLVAGTIFLNNASTKEIGLDRLNPDGTLDTSFGTNGVVVTSPTDYVYADSVKIQANGQILVGGTQYPSPTNTNHMFLVARYNTNGSLDSAFGTNGIATGGYAADFAMALEPDGRIVLAGYTNVSGQPVFALARFLATGPQIIGSFTANLNPATVGSNDVTLTASNVAALNPGSTVTQVAFYVDSNGDRQLEPGTDQLLGYGSLSSSGTWTFTFPTTGWASGSYTLFAKAEDSYGAFSDPLALTLTLP
jgi:uncharacterized delta-60 repeat protein